MEAQAIQSHRAFAEPWYYSIELAPDLYTPGANHQNVALTRELLRRVDVEGAGPGGAPAGCLDIGTQEGMIPVLLERRGASVVAYDRELRRPGLELVSLALGTEFELIGDLKLAELPRATAQVGDPLFDVVVLSGVLYHMFDPLFGLSVARGLARNGGVLIVETMAAFDDSVSMHFNSANRFTPHALWLISVPCLDYLLRFVRLEALDVVYQGTWEKSDCPPHGRIAVACRAVSEVDPEPGDTRITGTSPGDDFNFAECLDWAAVESDEPAVGYEAVRTEQVRRPGGTLDLLSTVRANPAHPVTPGQIRLDLDAKY